MSPNNLKMKPPAEPDPPEAWHQKDIIYKAALHSQEWPDLTWLYHVPNGGYRGEATGEEMKRQGVRPGVEDLALDIPRLDPETGQLYHGWRGELKRCRNSTPSEQQKDWMAFHESQGYWASWHRGSKALWEDLMRYLHLPRVAPAPVPRPDRSEQKPQRSARRGSRARVGTPSLF